MSEVENVGFFKGLDFDYVTVRKGLFDLYCYFTGCRSLISSDSNEIVQSIKQLQEEFFLEEISRLLIQSAALCREIINRSEAESDEEPGYRWTCGHLEEPIGSPSIKLSVRETCNKIIHARKVNFDDESPMIYVYGTRKQKEWKASIDVVVFVGYCFRIASARSLVEFMAKDHQEARAKRIPFWRESV